MNKEKQNPKAKQQGFTQSIAFRITVAAVFAALVFVVTSQIPPIPIPATSGYFNIGETTIYIAALVFGPLVGALAGGIGSALSDIYLGYALVCSRYLIYQRRRRLNRWFPKHESSKIHLKPHLVRLNLSDCWRIRNGCRIFPL